jgi:hypothetical protein
MEREGSLPFSQEPDISPYSEPDETNPYLPYLSNIHSNIYHLYLDLPSGLFPSDFRNKRCTHHLHLLLVPRSRMRGAIPPPQQEGLSKFSGLSHNEMYANNKTHIEKQHIGLWRQNSLDWLTKSDTTASNGREMYHFQFSLQAASPETFGYTLVRVYGVVLS